MDRADAVGKAVLAGALVAGVLVLRWSVAWALLAAAIVFLDVHVLFVWAAFVGYEMICQQRALYFILICSSSRSFPSRIAAGPSYQPSC